MFNLRWNSEVKLSDVFTFIGFTFTIISLFFAGIQLKRNTRFQRAQFLMNITERYFGDENIRKLYYTLDYNKFKFDLDKFIFSDEERWLDGLLYTLDMIGQMVKMKVITLDEAHILAFQASRVLGNSEVIKYLEWLDSEYKRVGRPTPAHADARFLVDTISRTA